MQRGIDQRKALARRQRREWRRCHGAHPHPLRPAKTHADVAYGVHMRNTSGPGRGSWATYVRSAREHRNLSIAELARRVGVDRGTVHRWEGGRNRPESADVVGTLADVLGLDVDEALAAAGLRPGVGAPAQPTVEVDEELELVRTDDRLTERQKSRIIEIILERREQQRAASIEETRRVIDLFRRSA